VAVRSTHILHKVAHNIYIIYIYLYIDIYILSRYYTGTQYSEWPLQGTYDRSLSGFCFKKKTGPQGTPHLQGTVKCRKRMRLTELRAIEPKIRTTYSRTHLRRTVQCLYKGSGNEHRIPRILIRTNRSIIKVN
jgi:hypothetical protein